MELWNLKSINDQQPAGKNRAVIDMYEWFERIWGLYAG